MRPALLVAALAVLVGCGREKPKPKHHEFIAYGPTLEQLSGINGAICEAGQMAHFPPLKEAYVCSEATHVIFSASYPEKRCYEGDGREGGYFICMNEDRGWKVAK